MGEAEDLLNRSKKVFDELIKMNEEYHRIAKRMFILFPEQYDIVLRSLESDESDNGQI